MYIIMDRQDQKKAVNFLIAELLVSKKGTASSSSLLENDVFFTYRRKFNVVFLILFLDLLLVSVKIAEHHGILSLYSL